MRKRRPERVSFKVVVGMSHLKPDPRRLRLFCFGGKILGIYKDYNIYGAMTQK